MTFPSRTAYNQSVLQLSASVSDPKLSGGSVRRTAQGRLEQYSGGFAIVYAVECGDERYALKCWTHDIGDVRKRYDAVTNHLGYTSLPYFVDFAFKEGGIQVEGKTYPILRMGWVSANSLDEFVGRCVEAGNTHDLSLAADTFRKMSSTLRSHNIAHGDLQGPNIKVKAQNGTVDFTLIDYDTMVVPSLVGTRVSASGSPHYQHPDRALLSIATDRDDYFSNLTIYLSLRAVCEDLTLWERFHRDDDTLLFTSDDFKTASPPEVFRQIYQLGGVTGRLAVCLWNFRCCTDIRLIPSLEEAIQLAETGGVSPTPPPAAAGNPFDDFLKSKLNQTEPPQQWFARLPTSWVDDSAFRATASASASVPEYILPTTTAPSRSSAVPPPLPPAASSRPAPPPLAEIIKSQSAHPKPQYAPVPPVPTSTFAQRFAKTVLFLIVLGAFILLLIALFSNR